MHILLCLLLLVRAAFSLEAQENDDKVLLLHAKSAQLIEKDGESFRKVVGPARFFHNNTYLDCDTALWNINTNIIDAIGNVRILQEKTKLSSSTLKYIVDENMARFRGDLVQLEDSDKNILRTRYLDYNTKDSVAIFQDGGAMRDKDGQIIESRLGTYDSKASLFVFTDKVNMYMDTSFIKTSRLEYRSDISTAYFGYNTDMWQDDKMLSANDGWYDRNAETFFFRRQVHLLTKKQEIWADTLFYYRTTNDVDMRGKVEVMDTTQNTYALAGRMEYTDSISQIIMTREPAIMVITGDTEEERDSLYIGAEVLKMLGRRKCDIEQNLFLDAQKRLEDVSGDPVSEYRRKAAEAAAAEVEEAARKEAENSPGLRPPTALGDKKGQASGSKNAKSGDEKKPPLPEKPPAPAESPADSLAVPADSLAVPADSLTAPLDSLAAPLDSLAMEAKVEPPPDTTKINFIWGSKRVRMFRRNMQMVSDSLAYNELDSLVRVYKDPIVYSDGNRQYASDSIYLVMRNQKVDKAHLLSNAFITIHEQANMYDQIRGTEVIAYFDSTSALRRFDALGGASTVFYLEEQGALATVNKVESKMLYATFKDGEMEKIYYFDNPSNDGYPTVQLPEDERKLKGFRWEPERRPQSPLDVTSLTPRASERLRYLAKPHVNFEQTDIYFPGYIKKVYRDIAIRDSLHIAREMAERDKPIEPIPELSEEEIKALADTTETLPSPADSLTIAPADSLSAKTDLKEEKADEEAKPVISEKERQKALKQAKREAKWAEKDKIYEEKKARKAQKKLEKERAKKLKILRKLEKKAQKEKAKFEKYLRKYQEK